MAESKSTERIVDYNVCWVSHRLTPESRTDLVKIVVPSVPSIHFRPHENWQGEYGMDWFRLGDSSLRGKGTAAKEDLGIDDSYNDICAKYVRNYQINSGLNESTRAAEVSKLKAIYQKMPIAIDTDYSASGLTLWPRKSRVLGLEEKFRYPIAKNADYFVPFVTLWPGKSALFDVVEKSLDPVSELELKYDYTLFSVKESFLCKLSKGDQSVVKIHRNALKITCLKAFEKPQDIKLYTVNTNALGQHRLVGQMTVLPNYRVEERTVLFIPAKVWGRDASVVRTDEKKFLATVLKQAYIKAKIIKRPQITIRKPRNTRQKLERVFNSDPVAFLEELDRKFFSRPSNDTPEYRRAIRIYVMGKFEGAYGMALLRTGPAFVRGGRTKATAVHEALHAMGLYHTFDNDAPHTFKQAATDNVMDYSHYANIAPISTSIWQWRILFPGGFQ